jgi:apolipoprotein D and lipocalin family protein
MCTRTSFVASLSPLLLILFSCSTTPEYDTNHIPLVSSFDLNRYLGTWYEIARLPHRFEKNLTKVTATYSLRDDGKIKVVNRGFDPQKNKWSEANGKAWIPDPKVPARLKVSFFWFFSADYRIIDLDQQQYSYAMVTSNSRNYFWILSRTPALDDTIYTTLIGKARQYGFDTEKIEKVSQ